MNQISFDYFIISEVVLKDFLETIIPLKLIKWLKMNKGIKVNNQDQNTDYKLKPRDKVTLVMIDEPSQIIKTNQPINIIYEDPYFIVVIKPKDLDIIPTKANPSNTLSNYVMAYYQSINLNSTIHIVNRLDKITQGLVVIAKYRYIHYLFSQTKITKKYLAHCTNPFFEKRGMIDAPILKKDQLRCVDPLGKPSQTRYEVLDDGIVDITLITGRTHQIRVHMQYINHALHQDHLYGLESEYPFYLNSYYLSFIHPITKQTMEFNIKDYPKHSIK